MSEYIKMVISAVVAASVITALFSGSNISKYISLISSIIVMAVILTPVLKITSEPLEIPTEALEIQTEAYVKEEVEKELAGRIKEELQKKTGTDFTVLVTVGTDKELTVKQVKISPYSESSAKIVREYLELGEDVTKVK